MVHEKQLNGKASEYASNETMFDISHLWNLPVNVDLHLGRRFLGIGLPGMLSNMGSDWQQNTPHIAMCQSRMIGFNAAV